MTQGAKPNGGATGGFMRIATSALPVGLRRDPLYLRASHSLRRRPWKVFLWVALLGLFCWQGQELGSRHVAPILRAETRRIADPQLRNIFYSLSGALFSSLNLLSGVGVVLLAGTMRGMISRGAMDEIQLTLLPARPSSLYYALAPRWLPLAFISLLPLFLSPGASVFSRHPFVTRETGTQIGMAGMTTRLVPSGPVVREELPTDDPRVFFFAAAYLISLTFFCGANLMTDLAIGFWIFARWRPSAVAAGAAVFVVSLLTPAVLMVFRVRMDARVLSALRGSPDLWLLHSLDHVSSTLHYSITGAGSLILAWLLLADLNRRWYRTLRSADADPVMFRF